MQTRQYKYRYALRPRHPTPEYVLVLGLPKTCPQPRVHVVYLGSVPRKHKRMGKLGLEEKKANKWCRVWTTVRQLRHLGHLCESESERLLKFCTLRTWDSSP